MNNTPTFLQELRLICHEVRRKTLQTILRAEGGHIGGSLSSVELLVALYFGGILRYDPEYPKHPNRDRVLIRGHLGPLRYSIFSLLGWITEDDLLSNRQLGSNLQGHESMDLVPGVDITPSGSLGMILSYGVGCAFALRSKDYLHAKTYVLLGDGEEQEGNISEAARHAAHLGLNKLVCIIDCNSKQLSRPTDSVDSKTNLEQLWLGYGWEVSSVTNGNSLREIITTFDEVATSSSDSPKLIIANTIKGKGVEGSEEHPSGYHTLSACSGDSVHKTVVAEQEAIQEFFVKGLNPSDVVQSRIKAITKPDAVIIMDPVKFVPDIQIPLTNDFDEATVGCLKDLSDQTGNHASLRFYSLTADWTIQDIVHQCGFNQQHVLYLDVGIREQHLFAMSHGISVTDQDARILLICGDCFILRSGDQLNTISQAQSPMVIIGTDSGLCATTNGSTHQSTGQPGALVNMPGLTMLEPADAVDLANCLNWAFGDYSKPIYIRLHSGVVDFLPIDNIKRNLVAYIAYEPSSCIRANLVSSGLTLGESVKLAQQWDEQRNLGLRVINVIDMHSLGIPFTYMLEPNKPVLTIYNGDSFVLQSSIARAVMDNNNTSERPLQIVGHGFSLGTTGKLSELMRYFQLDSQGIGDVLLAHFPDL